MLNIASAIIMACVGQTYNFKADLQVDMAKASVAVNLQPLDQSSAPLKLNYSNLPRQGFCLANKEIKFCNSPLTENATIELDLDDGSGALSEKAPVVCQTL